MVIAVGLLDASQAGVMLCHIPYCMHNKSCYCDLFEGNTLYTAREKSGVKATAVNSMKQDHHVYPVRII